MIEKINFNLDYNDYMIIETNFATKLYDYKEKNSFSLILPKYIVLQVDNISMGGQYKGGLFVVLKKPKNLNSHITEKIPSKFKIEIDDLNGMEYTLFRGDDVGMEKKLNSVLRKSKIENLLQNEA